MAVRILIVDDNRDNADSLACLCLIYKHHADAVYTGRDALLKLVERRYDLVILDYAMPDMSGLDVLREIRARDASQCVYVCSGYASGGREEEALRNGADAYLVKPYGVERLFESLSSWKCGKVNAA